MQLELFLLDFNCMCFVDSSCKFFITLRKNIGLFEVKVNRKHWQLFILELMEQVHLYHNMK